MRKVASLFLAAVLFVGASAASADRRQQGTLDRCALEFVDCATGPKSKCLVGAVQLDDDCVRACRGGYDACLRKTGTRADQSRSGLQPIPPRVPVPR